MGNTGLIITETLFGFVALFAITKVLGKTQISQLTAFDFISALIMGELVGNALFDDQYGLYEMGLAIFLWGGLLYLSEVITQKFKRSRSLLEGVPSIVIHKGKIKYNEMKKAKLDLNELQHLLRSKGAFSIKEVEYAVLETDGTISILKKSLEQAPTRKDFQLPQEVVSMPLALILDGELVKDNLKEAKRDEAWLHQQLQAQSIEAVKDVLYAEWKEGEPLYVLTY
ncbi:DUF421 domain-containing protein [Terrihalobacillus insolitus]|uniref:DUF421 domain-containing protein n=1 Tax=Terrihalobacillus insolitus TaxID=2950438 RepID=UPI0023412833|nr:DUF421 domain-containing protein [Terrihalobacillus insolitus]MDC3413656.1 DUF421 domain-containing protein [Terrihalobacillus insolitus]